LYLNESFIMLANVGFKMNRRCGNRFNINNYKELIYSNANLI